MLTPTRNPYYNALLRSWGNGSGVPALPVCEECGADMTGGNVHCCEHQAAAWICDKCHQTVEAGELVAEPTSRELRYAGNGYAVDSRGNYREAFWAGSP